MDITAAIVPPSTLTANVEALKLPLSGEGIVIPKTLPNPHPLTFTGAVSATYDGSAPVQVVIPQGGNAGSEGFELIDTFDFSSGEMSKPFASRVYEVDNVTEIVVVWQGIANESATASSFLIYFEKNGKMYALGGNIGKAGYPSNGYTYFKILKNCGTMVLMSLGALSATNYGRGAECLYNLLPITQPTNYIEISNNGVADWAAKTGIVQVFVR